MFEGATLVSMIPREIKRRALQFLQNNGGGRTDLYQDGMTQRLADQRRWPRRLLA